MAGTNNFLVFNEANNPSNTMNDADYLADLYRLNGLIPMIADPNAHNKMFRQWSIMVTALANIIASMNYNASDSNLSTLEANLKFAIEDVAEAKVDSRISTLENWKDDITATTTELNYLSGSESNIQQQINAITGVLSSPFPTWNKSTPYTVGDICIASNFKSYQYLECVVAGITGATMPAYADVGQMVTDNEVKWLVCDWRDSNPVGTIKQDLVVRDGYVLLDGQALNTADYPRLVKFLEDNNLILNYNDSHKVGVDFYYVNPEKSVFLIPDFLDKFIENDSTALNRKSAGLPNITGEYKPKLAMSEYTLNRNKISVDIASGAFKDNLYAGTYAINGGLTYDTSYVDQGPKGVTFDASRSSSIYGNSNTVQPPAVTLIPIIKY